MSRPLRDIDYKIMRAEEHLHAIKEEIRRYVQSKPYMQVREYEPWSKGQHRLAGLRITDEPSPYIATQVGDFLHNLRASLEYLTWQLVLANGGTPTEKTGFPILDGPPKHKGEVSPIRIDGGVNPKALALIEGAQPYVEGKAISDYALIVVRSLSNIDKHRHLNLVGAWVEGGEFFTLRVPPDDVAAVWFLGSKPPPESDMDMEAQRALSVAFAEPPMVKGREVGKELERLLQFVRDALLPRFTPFLHGLG